jgi:hypothetical protein
MKRYLTVGAVVALIVSWASLALGGSSNGTLNGTLNGTFSGTPNSANTLNRANATQSTELNQRVRGEWKFLDGLSALVPVAGADSQGGTNRETDNRAR